MPQRNNEVNILLALQALQRDPKLSVRRAAALYRVSEWSIRRRQKGMLSRASVTPNSRKLSDLEEQTIVEYILDLDSRGFPPRLLAVEEMANRLLAEREAQPVSKRWAHNFIRRQPQLQMRSFRKYDYKRA
jgi:hypothetical protein